MKSDLKNRVDTVKTLTARVAEARDKETEELTKLFDNELEEIKTTLINGFRHSKYYINEDGNSLQAYIYRLMDEHKQYSNITVDIENEIDCLRETKRTVDNAMKNQKISVTEVVRGTLKNVLKELKSVH